MCGHTSLSKMFRLRDNSVYFFGERAAVSANTSRPRSAQTMSLSSDVTKHEAVSPKIPPRQTGLPALRIADLGRDTDLIPQVQKTADILLNGYPKHVQSLIKRWIADRLMFGKV